jgi:hypothetical protein
MIVAMITEEPRVDARASEPGARRGPDRWQIVVLVLCFVSGVVGWWINQPRDESFNAVDVGFLSDMETHHNGAIALSFDYLGREHDSLVGHFAREIIVGQSQEIAANEQLPQPSR